MLLGEWLACLDDHFKTFFVGLYAVLYLPDGDDLFGEVPNGLFVEYGLQLYLNTKLLVDTVYQAERLEGMAAQFKKGGMYIQFFRFQLQEIGPDKRQFFFSIGSGGCEGAFDRLKLTAVRLKLRNFIVMAIQFPDEGNGDVFHQPVAVVDNLVGNMGQVAHQLIDLVACTDIGIVV